MSTNNLTKKLRFKQIAFISSISLFIAMFIFAKYLPLGIKITGVITALMLLAPLFCGYYPPDEDNDENQF